MLLHEEESHLECRRKAERESHFVTGLERARVGPDDKSEKMKRQGPKFGQQVIFVCVYIKHTQTQPVATIATPLMRWSEPLSVNANTSHA